MEIEREVRPIPLPKGYAGGSSETPRHDTRGADTCVSAPWQETRIDLVDQARRRRTTLASPTTPTSISARAFGSGT
jgi:hypothetical protein